jgi:dynactin complex subunit
LKLIDKLRIFLHNENPLTKPALSAFPEQLSDTKLNELIAENAVLTRYLGRVQRRSSELLVEKEAEIMRMRNDLDRLLRR